MNEIEKLLEKYKAKLATKIKSLDSFKDCNNAEIQNAIPLLEKEKHDFELIISAVEKQIPKRVVHIRNFKSYRCPICKCEVETDYEEYGYCQECGQKLEWN